MASNQPMKKLDASGDARLLPGAAALRASGLDELGQFINVLRGEMSIVGPRPCLPYEFERYTDHHKRRLEALPGITGFWQVGGKDDTTFEEMINLDIQYTERQSVGTDLLIVLRTLLLLPCTTFRWLLRGAR